MISIKVNLFFGTKFVLPELWRVKCEHLRKKTKRETQDELQGRNRQILEGYKQRLDRNEWKLGIGKQRTFLVLCSHFEF